MTANGNWLPQREAGSPLSRLASRPSEGPRAATASLRRLLLVIASIWAAQACAAGEFHPAFSLRLQRTEQTPRRATVTIDDQYVGTLDYVGARGVRLLTGEHRISVEHSGYFPYDTTIKADESRPVTVVVKMDPIPD